MDALYVMDRMDTIHPYYQPVINADDFKVIGYEVLGRIEGESGVTSLGPFFTDATIPPEYKWEVDRELYKQAVAWALTDESKPKLHFNVDALVLGPLNKVEELMQLFASFENDGLLKQQVVFEIRLQGFKGELDEMTHVFHYMRASGYTVSLDDVRITDTHLDQFSTLEPNIIKVDVSDLRETTSYTTYSEILDTLAFYTRKLGTTLHFKGIQNTHQLQMAWRHGGRYLQGYLFQKPASERIPVESFKDLVKASINTFIDSQHKRLSKELKLLKRFDRSVVDCYKKENEEALLEKLSAIFRHESFRMYICDSYGYQLSPNWRKNEEIWDRDDRAVGKNWSWRTYFLDQVMEMNFNKNGMLSDKYRDIETNEVIRTYSFPINEEAYLFIDLDPLYLYEQNWLLQ
ncbi:EAL domain-containing protein [Paenalkalicoccus suaedae]|uniref:EAL domain-containing protein n=1 Tax=Paenalkalicoccus suaedae TaxID=2592382 RepID=A0A859FER8_9BACI|nr:EAL-associated domain-containing protein [Paenalkalicoccus suaedae]QKS71328.1 EAL domain-containing protein [Paenalkalicoccus suaedae]